MKHAERITDDDVARAALDIVGQIGKEYAGRTGFDAATVAAFLARIMRERRLSSPREIHMSVIRDHYLRTRDGDELCAYAAPRHVVTLTENGIRAEDAILARQEID